jgi:hypothetical protein
MNGGDTSTLHAIKSMMNDFRIVENSNKKLFRKVPIYKRDENNILMVDENGVGIQVGTKMKEYPAKLTPEDVAEEFHKMVDYIGHVIQNDPEGKFVVVGHHAPSKLSTHPRYQNDTLMNGGYSSSLDFFIEDHPQIKLWTHGHTHETFDYVIGETRVVCNPRGYDGYEERAEKFKLKFIEV